jgi:hypothetical protein
VRHPGPTGPVARAAIFALSLSAQTHIDTDGTRLTAARLFDLRFVLATVPDFPFGTSRCALRW